jgi:hypothetical protein
MADGPSPRRFVLVAAALVIPAVLAALLLPRLQKAAPQAAAAARAVTGASAEPPAPPEKRPDAPTIEQIEARRAAEENLAEAQKGWQKVEVMAPRDGRKEGEDERVLPFQGFGLSVDSTPAGAAVTVDGNPVGVTPVLTSLKCKAGDPIAIELSLPRRGVRKRQVRCRTDQFVSLTVAFDR